MSQHKNPAYQNPALVESLKAHGLAHDTPSQVSDGFRFGWQAAIQHARDVAVKACEEQADHKEQAKADAASRAAKDETSQLMRLQHWSTVSTYNAGIRRCADAIKEALK